MAQRWEEFIQEASLDGVVFDVISTRDHIGHDLDKQKFPLRRGQRVVHRGAQPEDPSFTAIFAEDLGTYPETLQKFLAVCRKGRIVEYVHPIFGARKVAIENVDIVHDAEEFLDGCMVSVQCAEHTDDARLMRPDTSTTPSRANAVRTAAEDTRAAATSYQTAIEVQAGPAGADLSAATVAAAIALASAAYAAADAAATVADALERDGETLSAVDVYTQVNAVLASANAVAAKVADYTGGEAYELGRATLAMCAELSALATAVVETKPALIEVTIEADIPLLAFVHARYGDSSRVGEVLALNSIPDPLKLERGTVLRVYAS